MMDVLLILRDSNEEEEEEEEAERSSDLIWSPPLSLTPHPYVFSLSPHLSFPRKATGLSNPLHVHTAARFHMSIRLVVRVHRCLWQRLREKMVRNPCFLKIAWLLGRLG